MPASRADRLLVGDQPPTSVFTPPVRKWFESAFAEPTAAQAKAWPVIATGANVLISAPTGSGKTLAAFLWGIDRLVSGPSLRGPSQGSSQESPRGPSQESPQESPQGPRQESLQGSPQEPPREPLPLSLPETSQEHPKEPSPLSLQGSPQDPPRTRLVYISPLKALSYDIERNLRAPLRGIRSDLRVAVRTGDTPQRERQAMRRKPPDILITTPESLYLILTSQAREMLTDACWVIVDEIHALAPNKRGAHLALSLERLEQGAGKPLQRIGLSATVRPLEEVASYLVGPERDCQIVDAGVKKPLDLTIHVPVDSMVEPDKGAEVDLTLGIEPGSEATRRSIWPAIYPEILKMVREHRSTIVFVNNRRAAERLALRLNELADEDIARAHHGSLAREERSAVENMLKAGDLPCLVATSSLELGIDMGAVDCVAQVESPKSVTRGLQRIGRSGHGVTETAKGRIFPKFRADLLECAVVTKRMRLEEIESTVVPRLPLDVLAQQIVAMCSTQELGVDELLALIQRTRSYADISRRQLENVLDMLDGRYPSEKFADLKPRIVWDRVAGTVRARKGSNKLAIAGAGTIPDRGLFSVNLPDGRRIGELDEEMVHEARAGQVFLLGATSWRIEEITRDRVIVSPAPGVPGAVPFWRGEGIGRPRELGEAIGAFARWAGDKSAKVLARDYDLDERAANNLVQFLEEQRAATGVVPSDRTIVVERFRDEIGDWRLCVLSPYGGRVHSAWSLALGARIREEYGLKSDSIWSDDGIVVHLPDAEEPPSADLVLIDPNDVEDLVVEELGSSALFGARFRENAARALLIPRAYPGRRTPLWQQRLKSQALLEVAHRYSDFPIVLETYRECLNDVLDLPGLKQLLGALSRREAALVEVETPVASPFASSLLFDFVAAYMYEGDTPDAERRAAALALDRDLLRELVGQEELRELIDLGALEQLEADLQRTAERARYLNRDELHEVLRRLGDLTVIEARARARRGVDARKLLRELEAERRAAQIRILGEERWIAADDAGLYRDAIGAVPPAGLPKAFLTDVPDAVERLIRRYAQTHGPFTTEDLHGRYGIDVEPVLTTLERQGDLVRGELRPGGVEREWCDPEVLKRLRRASLAVLRKEIEPADNRSFARFLPAWQGIDRYSPSGAGPDRLREVLTPLQGLTALPETWERDILPRRVGAYSPAWLDQLCAAGEVVWIGAGTSGRWSGRVALYFREDARILGPPTSNGERPEEPEHDTVRSLLAEGACFYEDLLAGAELESSALYEALWDLVWAGEVTNDSFAPLRTSKRSPPDLPAEGKRRGGRRFSPRRRRQRFLQGRWSLAEPLFADGPEPGPKRRVLAELLLERYGILTREQVRAAGVAGGFSALYDQLLVLETLGIARRGYFIEGLGGAQFALPGAVERLREMRDGFEEGEGLVLAAQDPAQSYGAALPWPKVSGHSRRRPARVAGAYVVMVGAEPALYVERGGKGIVTLGKQDDKRLRRALEALVEHARQGRMKRLALERFDGEPLIGSPMEKTLVEIGFTPGPRRLTLSS